MLSGVMDLLLASDESDQDPNYKLDQEAPWEVLPEALSIEADTENLPSSEAATVKA